MLQELEDKRQREEDEKEKMARMMAEERDAARILAEEKRRKEEENEAALQRDCCICLCPFRVNEGVHCANSSSPHSVCDDCFSMHVQTESSADGDLLERRNGCVFCPLQQHGCEGTAAFEDVVIAQHVPQETFEMYTNAKMTLLEQRLASEIEADVKMRLEQEQARLEKLTQAQRAVDEARRHIEDLLNLKCPRCSSAFLDFNGCMALKCSRAGCGCGFCAWCQADCGDDAHQHVANQCPAKPPGQDAYFAPVDVWMAVQRQRHHAAITGYIRNLDQNLHGLVAQACERVLIDANLGDILATFGGGRVDIDAEVAAALINDDAE